MITLVGEIILLRASRKCRRRKVEENDLFIISESFRVNVLELCDNRRTGNMVLDVWESREEKRGSELMRSLALRSVPADYAVESILQVTNSCELHKLSVIALCKRFLVYILPKPDGRFLLDARSSSVLFSPCLIMC